jgi:hypothetical protein
MHIQMDSKNNIFMMGENKNTQFNQNIKIVSIITISLFKDIEVDKLHYHHVHTTFHYKSTG